MAQITFKGSPVNTNGNLPAVGSNAIDFQLIATDLSEVSLKDFANNNLVLNIFPSLDTSVCAASVIKFNKEVADLPDTIILAISKDLPFAHARFCPADSIENVKPLSAFRNTDFENHYGILMADGPLKGLFARAVVVIDKKGKVIYTELVPEIAQEPNYMAAIASLKCTRSDL